MKNSRVILRAVLGILFVFFYCTPLHFAIRFSYNILLIRILQNYALLTFIAILLLIYCISIAFSLHFYCSFFTHFQAKNPILLYLTESESCNKLRVNKLQKRAFSTFPVISLLCSCKFVCSSLFFHESFLRPKVP